MLRRSGLSTRDTADYQSALQWGLFGRPSAEASFITAILRERRVVKVVQPLSGLMVLLICIPGALPRPGLFEPVGLWGGCRITGAERKE